MVGIKQALSEQFKERCLHIDSPFGEGDAARSISNKVVEVLSDQKIDLKKKFYDMR